MKTSKPSHSNKFIYSYAMGEFGFTFFLFFIAYYLMLFMTDVLQLPMGLAAIIYTALQWVEGFTMMVAGVVIDRVRTKWGKFRPWLVIGSVACLIGTTVFYTAWNIPTWAKATLFILFYTLAYTGYNFMWVGYRTLVGPMSRNPQDTIALTTASSQMGSLCGLVFSFVCVRLLSLFPSEKANYSFSAFVYCAIMVGCMLIASHVTKPFDNAKMYADGEVDKTASFKEMLSVFSKPMVVYFIAVSFRESVSTLLPTLLVYYFRYVIGDASLVSTYLTVTSLTSLVGYFFARRLANVYGKKKMFIAASLISSIAIFSINFVGTKLVPFMILMGVNAFCSIFSGAMIPANMQDIADYNEETRGVHARAFTLSVGGLAIRVAAIIGGALGSFGLASIGYQKGVEATPAMAAAITKLMTYGCSGVILMSVLVFCFFQLDQKTMDAVYARRQAQMQDIAE